MRQILVIILFYSSIATANINKMTIGNVSAATGSAGIATVEAGDSAFLNPATLVHLKGYQITTSHRSNSNRLGKSESQSLITITDNGYDAVVPASLAAIHREFYWNNSQVKAKGFRVALSNFLAPQVSMGLGINHAQSEVLGQRYLDTNVDFGFLYTPTPEIGLGLVAYNIIAIDKVTPNLDLTEPAWGIGANYIYQGFIRVRLDLNSGPQQAPSKFTYQGGFESFLSEWFVVRIGAQRDDFKRENRITGGLGFMGPKFQVNYAYQMSPQDDSLASHGVDLVIPF